MAINSYFGYALRHKIYYNPVSKRGNITLWSQFTTSSTGQGPMGMSKDTLSRLYAPNFNALNSLLGSSLFTEIQIGNDSDVMSLLAALELVKDGKTASFANYDNRIISLSKDEVGEEQEEVIIAKIGSNDKTGKLAIAEIQELENFLQQIIREYGYSKTEIIERLAARKQSL